MKKGQAAAGRQNLRRDLAEDTQSVETAGHANTCTLRCDNTMYNAQKYSQYYDIFELPKTL